MKPIDPFSDLLVPLSELAYKLPHPPSHTTLWRWHRVGVSGVKLETVLIGRRRYTTKAAFESFVNELTRKCESRD